MLYAAVVGLEVLFLVVLTKTNLEYTLSTKITAEGDVLVVGISEHGTEVFKLYMNQGENENEEG